MSGVVTVYEGKDGWRWHRVVSSDVVSESGEAYANKTDAIDMAKANAQTGDTFKVHSAQSVLEFTYEKGEQ